VLGGDIHTGEGDRVPDGCHAGCLWVECVGAEILMIAGGSAGALQLSQAGWCLAHPLSQLGSLLRALGASDLGVVHRLSRMVPAATSAQSIYAAASPGLGGGLAMLTAGPLYAD